MNILNRQLTHVVVLIFLAAAAKPVAATDTAAASAWLQRMQQALEGCISEIHLQCAPLDYQTRAEFKTACEKTKISGSMLQCDTYVQYSQSTDSQSTTAREQLRASTLPAELATQVERLRTRSIYAHALMNGLHQRSFIADPEAGKPGNKDALVAYRDCVIAAGESADPRRALARCASDEGE